MDMIAVNGLEIPPAIIAAEAQHHPAGTPDEAMRAAAEALVVRELLRQRARDLGIAAALETDADGRRETEEEAAIRQLLDREVTTPEADEAACRRYYDNNPARFRSPDLYEAAHILIAADPADRDAYSAAVDEAAAIIAALGDEPGTFAAIARDRSACPSGDDGGRLGQVARGQTVPEFETFLISLEEGQLCPVPVKTRFGAHVLRLDRRIEGRALPFEAVGSRIAEYLVESSWRRGVAQYVSLLAGAADIRGIALRGADGPLVR